jgi:hypothetical protein
MSIDDKKSTILISAFPGVGKSYLFKNLKDYKILDSDSSKFDKDLFPVNYIDHIKQNIGVVDIIMISTHDVVRQQLEENGLFFVLVYPDISLKDEYIGRYNERGNDDNFIKILGENWDNWINDIEKQKGCLKIKLQSGEFLGDFIK